MNLASAIYSGFYPYDQMGLFKEYKVVMQPDDLTTDDVLLVHGGSDISPSLYQKAVGSRTGASHQLSGRDHCEWQLMKKAKTLGIPIIGICRGAQMLCALEGGFLIQDVTNHGRSHEVVTNDKRKFSTNSCHHQMLNPFNTEHEIVCQTTYSVSDHYLDVDEKGKDIKVEMPFEPEFVYFPKAKGIAIQWHPEWMDIDCMANQFVKEKVREYCAV